MSSPPIVVQGTAVSNPHASGGGGAQITQYTKQTKCQDPLFVPLFYIDIVLIVVVAGMTGATTFEDSEFSDEYKGYYYSAVIAALVGLVLSAGGLQVMMCIPQTLIKAALIFSVVMSFLMMVFSFLSGNILGAIFGLLFFLMSCCYAWCVWSRIPFATANLVTAISAVKANCGITIAAYVFCILMALWSFVWAVAWMGTMGNNCEGNSSSPTTCAPTGIGWFYLFMLFIAFFFIHQVLQVRYYLLYFTIKSCGIVLIGPCTKIPHISILVGCGFHFFLTCHTVEYNSCDDCWSCRYV